MSDNAMCACLRVKYVRVDHDGGTCSASWVCESCGHAFWPTAFSDAWRAETVALGRRVAELERERDESKAHAERLREALSEITEAAYAPIDQCKLCDNIIATDEGGDEVAVPTDLGPDEQDDFCSCPRRDAVVALATALREGAGKEKS